MAIFIHFFIHCYSHRYISSELLQGLNYLHTLPNPIVHRDIKPSNILVLTDCDCPNPLACVCRLRPQIVSDYLIYS